ncbi:MAG TPA: Ig-like domain-containing protein, partial [Verrucomicrobiae bacterium]|nr:Ig-like domain-containing protein [Verrucomicrobiae bacterium]
ASSQGVAGLIADSGFVANSIFWSNYDSTYSLTAQFATGTVVSNCIIQNIDLSQAQFQNAGNSGADPQFLQGIDGATAPQLGGNFRLGACSPAVDAGANAYASLPFDLDGNPRISGSTADLGCHEYQQPPFVTQPANQSVSVLNAVQFFALSASTNAIYQWQMRSSPAGVFTNITDTNNFSGFNTSALTESNLTLGANGSQFRCVAMINGCRTVYSALATLNMTNAPPVVYNVSVTNAGDVFYIALSGSDPQGLPIHYYTNVTQPVHGGLFFSGGNQVEYYALTNYFSGTDSFQYVAYNGSLYSAPATVNITILQQHVLPFVTNQNISALENTPVSFALNGSDPASNPMEFSVASSPIHGTLSGTPPNLTYTPSNYFYGRDSFTFRVADASDVAQATANITVSHVPQNPVAAPDSAVVYRYGSVTIPVLQNDLDPDTNAFSITAVSQAAYGNVTFTPTNVTYTQNSLSATNDTFTYQITDTHGGTNSATVSISILTNYTYVVTNTADIGPGTLRDAIHIANTLSVQPFAVTFSPALAGQTILLQTADDAAFGSSAFALSNSISIDAGGAPGLVLARAANAPAMRLFRVDAAAHALVNNLILSNGFAIGGAGQTNSGGGGGGGGGFGGAIYSHGALALNNITFTGNEAQGGLGGQSFGPYPLVGGAGGGPNGGAPGSGMGGFGSGGGGASGSIFGPAGAGGFGGGAGGG